MTIFLKNLDLSKLKKPRKTKAKAPTRPKIVKKPKVVAFKKERIQVISFPVKLHRMLSEVEREGKEDIVSWCSDGRTFQVHDHSRFVEEILPRHFRQSKYKSFQRQLNFYAFVRVTSGCLEGAYGHHNFIRGNEEAARLIKRTAATVPPAAGNACGRTHMISTDQQYQPPQSSACSSSFPNSCQPQQTDFEWHQHQHHHQHQPIQNLVRFESQSSLTNGAPKMVHSSLSSSSSSSSAHEVVDVFDIAVNVPSMLDENDVDIDAENIFKHPSSSSLSPLPSSPRQVSTQEKDDVKSDKTEQQPQEQEDMNDQDPQSEQDRTDEESINKIIAQFRGRGSFILSSAGTMETEGNSSGSKRRDSFHLIHEQLRRNSAKLLSTMDIHNHNNNNNSSDARLSFVGRSFFVLPVDFTDI